jgi:hypothetical protein
MMRALGLLSITLATTSAALAQAPRVPAATTPQSTAPVDLTGYWAAVITEDWAWRMRTPPKGDFASVPLNAAGTRIGNTWTEDQDGSCLAFGAPSMLRTPTRVHITWADDYTLQLETDNGAQTRRLRFAAQAGAAAASTAPRSLQGNSVAEWDVGADSDGRAPPTRASERRWAPLKVVTTNLRAAWLRPNGAPYSENTVLTEYFDWFAEGEDAWFVVTTIVDDPTYLTEPLVISSNFKREPNGAKWRPTPCKG